VTRAAVTHLPPVTASHLAEYHGWTSGGGLDDTTAANRHVEDHAADRLRIPHHHTFAGKCASCGERPGR
jgi:hypothetical protein